MAPVCMEHKERERGRRSAEEFARLAARLKAMVPGQWAACLTDDASNIYAILKVGDRREAQAALNRAFHDRLDGGGIELGLYGADIGGWGSFAIGGEG